MTTLTPPALPNPMPSLAFTAQLYAGVSGSTRYPYLSLKNVF